MLGDVDGGAAIFAAEREALEQAEADQQRGGEQAGVGVGREEPDRRGGAAHQADGDEKGVFAADAVAEPAEQEGAEGPDPETGTEGGEAGEGRGGWVVGGEEQAAEQGGEDAVDEEVVPFEHRAQRAGGDHQPVALRVYDIFIR